MTPNEQAILTYLAAKGQATDSQLQNQFDLSSGALATIVRPLKAKLFVEQSGRYYRVTSLGQAALEPTPQTEPFVSAAI